MNKKIILALLLIVFPFSVCVPSVEDCGNLWGIKKVKVKDNHILIEFGNPLPLGGANYINWDGTIGKDISLENPAEIKIGEKITWEDGDHVFYTLKLKEIINNEALVVITEEHRPPPTHTDLKYKKTKECKISGIN